MPLREAEAEALAEQGAPPLLQASAVRAAAAAGPHLAIEAVLAEPFRLRNLFWPP